MRTMEESGLERTALAGDSSMPMISVVGMILRRGSTGVLPRRSRSSSSISRWSPMRSSSSPASRMGMASRQPRRMASGAWSPPMTSTPMRIRSYPSIPPPRACSWYVFPRDRRADPSGRGRRVSSRCRCRAWPRGTDIAGLLADAVVELGHAREGADRRLSAGERVVRAATPGTAVADTERRLHGVYLPSRPARRDQQPRREGVMTATERRPRGRTGPNGRVGGRRGQTGRIWAAPCRIGRFAARQNPQDVRISWGQPRTEAWICGSAPAGQQQTLIPTGNTLFFALVLQRAPQNTPKSLQNSGKRLHARSASLRWLFLPAL